MLFNSIVSLWHRTCNYINMANTQTQNRNGENEMEKQNIETVKRIMKRQIIELIEKGANPQQIKDSLWNAWNEKYPEILNAFINSQ